MKALMFALAFVTTAAIASPGDDGCVGNCGGNNQTTPTVQVGETTNTNRNLNVNSNVARGGHAVGIGGSSFAMGGSAVGNGGVASANGGSQDQSQTQSQSQRATSSAVNSGVSQSVTFQEAQAPTDVKVRTVGEAPSLLTNTTSNCRIAISASAGWLGGAFGFGTSVVDENCEIITMSQHMHNLGLQVESIELLCESPRARKVMKSRCPQEEAPQERVAP